MSSVGVRERVGDRLEAVVKRATRKHEKRVVLVAGGAGVGDAGGDDATGAQGPPSFSGAADHIRESLRLPQTRIRAPSLCSKPIFRAQCPQPRISL